MTRNGISDATGGTAHAGTPSMPNYRVFYHKTMIVPYDPPTIVNFADYREIGTVAAADLEDLFRDMNAVDGTETCCRMRVRSMSVGDVAMLEHTGLVFYCASSGWVLMRLDAVAS